MPSEPAAQHSYEQPARSDVAADAAVVLAALGRMEAAVRDERAAMDRLRLGLSEMAQAIAQAKAAMAPGRTIDTAALLDEFEHLVDAMIEVAGGARSAKVEPAPVAAVEPAILAAEAAVPEAALLQAAAENDQVPTVFDVVSRLGADAVEETQAADFTAVDAPTVAMLKAMVEALNASVPAAAAPEPEAAWADADATPQPAEPAAELPVAEQPAAVTAAVEAEGPDAIVEETPIAEAPAESAYLEPTIPEPVTVEATPEAAPEPQAPADMTPHESHLLASLEQMGTVPLPPLEIGTAVIFAPRIDQPKARMTEVETAEPAAAEAALHAPEPELHARIERDPDTLPALELPPEWFDADFNIEAPTAATPGPARPAFQPDAEFDAEEFLFGPEPEPEPAAFLLEPPEPDVVPPPIEEHAEERVEVQTESVEAAAEPDAAAFPSPIAGSFEPDQSAPAAQPAEPEPPRDPLGALKAMSAEERLALFS